MDCGHKDCMTTQTLCLRSQRLFQHVSTKSTSISAHVHIVMSMRTHNFCMFQITFFGYFYHQIFFFFQNKIIYSVSEQSLTTLTHVAQSLTMQIRVRVINNYANKVSVQSMTTLTHIFLRTFANIFAKPKILRNRFCLFK